MYVYNPLACAFSVCASFLILPIYLTTRTNQSCIYIYVHNEKCETHTIFGAARALRRGVGIAGWHHGTVMGHIHTAGILNIFSLYIYIFVYNPISCECLPQSFHCYLTATHMRIMNF